MLTPHDLSLDDRALLLRLIAAAKPGAEGDYRGPLTLAHAITESRPGWRATALAAWLLRFGVGCFITSTGRDGDDPREADSILRDGRRAVADADDDPAAPYARQALHLAGLAGVASLEELLQAAKAWQDAHTGISAASWGTTQEAIALLQTLAGWAGGSGFLDALAARLLEAELAGIGGGTEESE